MILFPFFVRSLTSFFVVAYEFRWDGILFDNKFNFWGIVLVCVTCLVDRIHVK
jgi:hypothetical protein